MLLTIQLDMAEYLPASFTEFSHLDEFQPDRVVHSRTAQQQNQEKAPEKIVTF